MICFKEEIILTQNECNELKQAYLEYYTKEKGWQISETTTNITFKKERWFSFNGVNNEQEKQNEID